MRATTARQVYAEAANGLRNGELELLERRLVKELKDLARNQENLKADVQSLRADFRGMQGFVTAAVAVNTGAFLAPVAAFTALAYNFGFFERK